MKQKEMGGIRCAVLDFFLISLFFMGCFLIVWHWQNAKKKRETLFLQSLHSISKKQERYVAQLKKGKRECSYLEQELQGISFTYHCLKNMGEVLEFSDTLQVFSESLRAKIKFNKAILALIQQEQKKLGNIFEIQFLSNKKKPIIEIKNIGYAEKVSHLLGKISPNLNFFVLEPGELFSQKAIMMPLMLQGELLGVLALETAQTPGPLVGLLAAEFSLEIKKKMFYERVKELSVSDSLTGLYLRRYFFQQLEFELERAEQCQTPISIILVDINQFKKMNDQYGHLAGDQGIQAVAKLLRENSREIDLVGRYGGDEFIVMLPQTARQEAGKVAQRLLEALEKKPVYLAEGGSCLTLSVGVASYPEEAKTVEGLIEVADKKLYAAKKR